MKITSSLDKNQRALKSQLESDDITFLPVSIKKRKGTIIFLKDIADKKSVGELVLKPIKDLNGNITVKKLENAFLSPEKKTVDTVEQLIEEIMLGNTAFLLDGIDVAFSFDLKVFEKRAITEPPTSAVIKGPREGFVESIAVNVSLMRRRIKSPSLKIENLTIGKFSKTPVALCYISEVVDPSLVKALRQKLRCKTYRRTPNFVI